ncbi:MAG: ExeM/NucH family extracellular endonuclease [Rubrivivax sp.]
MPAAYSNLLISEYIEGSSNNKAIEIYNGTGAAINLASGSYNLQMFFNGSASAGLTINLTGTVAAGDVYVVAQSSANAAILAQADQTNGSGWFNGDDAVVLRQGTTVLDVIGQIGFDPGTEWGTGLVSTADNTLRRKSDVFAGDANGADAFDPSVQWDGFALDTFGDLGVYSVGPAVVTVSLTAVDASAAESPSDSATLRFTRSGATSTDLTVQYGFSGTAAAGDLQQPLTGSIVIPAGQASVDLVLTPFDDIDPEGAESLTFSVTDGADYDPGNPAQATITIADDDVAPTYIHAIQGTGSGSPLVGQTVSVQAIVVGDFQGAAGLGGFFLQEEDIEADGDPNSSEGLFVFQGNSGTAVNVGDLVRVTGVVTEFGNGFSQLTELGSVSAVTVLSTGNPLPAATTVAFPLASAGALESLEGMRVTVVTPMTVTDNFTLGRFGEVLLSTDGPGNQRGTDARLDQFTQFNAPGASANAAYLDTIAGRRLVLDDGSDDQNPATVWGRDGLPLSAANTLRGGDTVATLTGVLDDRFGDAGLGAYRLQPTAPVDFDAGNPRPADPGVDGRIKVASFNVLNYFTTLGQRGADTLDELARQQAKLVSALSGLDADVVGLLELENNGYGPTSAIATLVNALNAAVGAGTYAYIDPGLPKLGTDAIAVGMIYKTGTVRPVGSPAVLDKSVDARFDSDNQRPSLAQTFEDPATGALFTPVINHLKSKGSAAALPGDADAGDGQGFSNATRTQAALALADWLATDPTHQGDGDFIVMGDLNAYAMEDPLQALRDGGDDQRGTADDLVDAIDATSYSYSFDGQWGSLDHGLVTRGLLHQLVDAGKWHINSDEPIALDYNVEFKSVAQLSSYYAPDAYRSTDHDPVVLGLNPGLVINGAAGSQLLTGTLGNDRLRGGGGRDLVQGGDGDDLFVFTSLLDAYDTVLDFVPGHDHLDIAALMASVNAAGADPVQGRYLSVLTLPKLLLGPAAAALPSYTLVLFDPDGGAGSAAARPLAELVGVTVLGPADLLG